MEKVDNGPSPFSFFLLERSTIFFIQNLSYLAAIDTMELESIPPLSRQPKGTSDTSCRSTALIKSSRTFLTVSSKELT